MLHECAYSTRFECADRLSRFNFDYTICMIAEREEIAQFLHSHFLFKQLSDSTIAEIAQDCGVLSIKPGKSVFTRGSPASAFCVLFSGSVSIESENTRASVIHGSDCFGYEALSNKPGSYRGHAVAREQALVLLFEPERFKSLLEKDPDLRKLIRLLLRFDRIKRSKDTGWLSANEDVKYITRRHAYDLYRKLTAPLTCWLISIVATLLLYTAVPTPDFSLFAWLGLGLGIALLWIIWLTMDWRNDYYVITDQRVLLLERTYLLYETRHETPLEAIQTIGIASELLGRLLTYGSVSVKTYTGSIKLQNLEAPALVVDMLDHYISRQKKMSSVCSHAEYEKVLQERITQPQKNHADRSDSVVEMLTPDSQRTGKRMFALKEITSDSIIYRTHWFILFRKVALPLLIFGAGMALLILHAQGKLSVFSTDWSITIGLILSLSGFAGLVYQFLDWRNDQYIITDDQLIDINRKPLGHEEKRTAPIRNIQTIEYKRKGVFGLLLNFGTVYIHVGDADLTFDFVHNPSQIQQELFAQFMRINQKEKTSQLEAESDRIVEWIKAYHQITTAQQDDSPQSKNE